MAWFNEDVWDEWTRMHEEMDNLFDRVFRARTPFLGHGKGKELVKASQGFRMPVCQMHQTPKTVVTTFEIPGVDKGDIELNVSDNSIEVKVEKKQQKEVKKKGMYSYASTHRQFYRRVPFPVEVNADKATADYKDGVLTVEVPKTKVIEEKTKRIQIK